MSILNHFFGNAYKINVDELKNEFGFIFITAFRIFRN